MNRIAERFEQLRHKNSKALVTFITAGDPDLATTEAMIHLLEEGGADIIELGMPFSDPMADGPTIQLATERALASGTTLQGILRCVRNVRTKSQIPLVLMGYLNPIFAYGYDNFARDAASAGVDGVLLVDMPPEEAAAFRKSANQYGLNTIFLLTPTSNQNRIDKVAGMGSGFLYYVTVTGVTGERQSISATLREELNKVKETVNLPLVAGFGISTPQQAAEIAPLADGVVVGSAIVKLFERYCGDELKRELLTFVRSLKQAID